MGMLFPIPKRPKGSTDENAPSHRGHPGYSHPRWSGAKNSSRTPHAGPTATNCLHVRRLFACPPRLLSGRRKNVRRFPKRIRCHGVPGRDAIRSPLRRARSFAHSIRILRWCKQRRSPATRVDCCRSRMAAPNHIAGGFLLRRAPREGARIEPDAIHRPAGSGVLPRR